MLQEGQSVPILSTDDHPAHVRGHSALLNDPDVRKSASYAQVILDHMLEHKRLAVETDPVLMGMVRTGKMPEGGMAQPMGQPGMGAPPVGAAGALGEPQAAAPAKDLVNREGVQ